LSGLSLSGWVFSLSGLPITGTNYYSYTYLHAQEKYMIKMIMGLLAGGEFDKPIKDLLLEIKFERKIERAGRTVNEDEVDEEDIDRRLVPS
jgi:hypothetical protein